MALSSKGFGQTCFADAGRDTLICPGECVTLGGVTPGSDTSRLADIVKYVWSPSSGLNNPSLAKPTACPSTRTVYTLTIYALNYNNDTICTASSTTIIDIKSTCFMRKDDLPQLTIGGSDSDGVPYRDSAYSFYDRVAGSNHKINNIEIK